MTVWLRGQIIGYATTVVGLFGLLTAPLVADQTRPSERKANPFGLSTRVNPPSVPFPNSILPEQVIENVKAILQETSLLEAARIGDQRAKIGDMRARRVLDVRSELSVPRYLVVEIVDGSGASLANMALTPDGHPMMIEDASKVAVERPLGLTVASSKVQQYRGVVPNRVGYVYFHNQAEPGISLCRPLVQADTGQGAFYLNARSEVFVENGSVLGFEMLGLAIDATARQSRELRSVGRW